jgi:hypothetical protein
VRGASDPQLERRFGGERTQRTILEAMARQFEPKFAFGFEGDIAYVLTQSEKRTPAVAVDGARRGRRRPGAPRGQRLTGHHLHLGHTRLDSPDRR